MTSQRALEYAAKPGVMVGLIAVAVAMHPASAVQRDFFLAALAFGLLSDLFLMMPRDMFLAGLVAALVEHLVYIAGFRARDLHLALLAVALVIALVSAAIFLPPIYRALKKARPSLVSPVLAYVAVFVVMVASAGATGSVVALAGALLFFYSDAILAWNRFVKPIRYGRIVNIVPYHVGEALLVLSLLT
ncbi:MAG: lysoplasmalogenase [Chloroflexi bacterium]|nr:MAG: lysoplasmalogenase [Chloroflexota bacterium]TMF35314.1 MAG: lysoplasmalogenase [Chloroflexota bacterium]